MKESGLSGQQSQKFSIKLEIDTRPPTGGIIESHIVERHLTLALRHYDLPSLFAGKLHAILFRAYTKGRDLYDFLWYVGKRTPVNLVLLENASRQTQNKEFHWDELKLKEALKERFTKTDFAKAQEDCLPFLEDPRAIKLLNSELLLAATNQLRIEPEAKWSPTQVFLT